jgi:hypothetical protein
MGQPVAMDKGIHQVLIGDGFKYDIQSSSGFLPFCSLPRQAIKPSSLQAIKPRTLSSTLHPSTLHPFFHPPPLLHISAHPK